MAAITTPLTGLIAGLRTPLVLGPMANAAGGSLAGQVSKAGGLGFIGIGFLAWKLSAINKGKPPSLGLSDLEVDSPALELIDVALKSKPIAIWLSFGDEEELIGWSTIVRQREASLHGMGRAVYGKDLKLFIGVGDEKQAKAAVEDCGADVIILQGNEAGGHGMGSSAPLSASLPLVAPKLKIWSPSNPSGAQPALLAAGGIMNGFQVAAVLAQGADGAVLGTRLLFTPESDYNDIQKELIVEAGMTSTKRSMAFDEARGTLDWPEGVDGRGIINETVLDFEAGRGGSAKARQEIYKEAQAKTDKNRIITWAGTGVGQICKIIPASEVIEEVTRECLESISRLQSLVESR